MNTQLFADYKDQQCTSGECGKQTIHRDTHRCDINNITHKTKQNKTTHQR